MQRDVERDIAILSARFRQDDNAYSNSSTRLVLTSDGSDNQGHPVTSALAVEVCQGRRALCSRASCTLVGVPYACAQERARVVNTC
jgi:hypothetical protein